MFLEAIGMIAMLSALNPLGNFCNDSVHTNRLSFAFLYQTLQHISIVSTLPI